MEKQYATATFGPSGHSASFAEEGHSSTLDMPLWLKSRNLELFEYSFGKGVRISFATAETIGTEADKYGIEISVHAPYYINMASVETEKAQNSIKYILDSLYALRAFHGSRCVFHSGAEGQQPRKEAFARTLDVMSQTLEAVTREGLDDLIICPEAMGKQAQIGTIDEIVALCNLGKNIYPCIDFGHVNALTGGALKDESAFQRIIDKLFDGIGEIKTKNMHMHFSKIQYGAKGEIRHLTFSDDVFGPEFEPLANVIVKNSLTPHILSESAGTQAEDASYMKQVYFSAAQNFAHI